MPETKNVNIELEPRDFDELYEFKESRGLTWEGVLKYGVGEDRI